MRPFLHLIVFFLVVTSYRCNEPVFTPKPRAFPKVNYPEKNYQPFDVNYCRFTFEYPTYAQVQQDTTFFDEKPADPCWFDLFIPDFDARLYCSYAPVTDLRSMDELKRDAFRMTEWHNKKATYIEEYPFSKTGNVKGILFEVEGPVASRVQFLLTDSLEQQHFLRCALYFNTQARPDSLAPVYEFLRKDVDRMLSTFEWK